MEAVAPEGAVVSFIEGMWRCNMGVEKHGATSVVKRPAPESTKGDRK